MTLKKGSKTVKVSMTEKAVLAESIKPMNAQAINLASEVTDDEEEDFLKANLTMVPVFEVDVIDIMDRYRFLGTSSSQCGQVDVGAPIEGINLKEISKEESVSQILDVQSKESDKDVNEAIRQAEALYEHTLGKSSRVKEDDLQDLD